MRPLPREGQSLVEACLTIGLVSLLFFGVFQVARIYEVRAMLDHAAARGARAKTVGFNNWMVRKVVRAATIPVAGAMRVPSPSELVPDPTLAAMAAARAGAAWDTAVRTAPGSPQAAIEQARISDYLATDDESQADNILDYDGWDELTLTMPTAIGDGNATMLKCRVSHTYPLWVPMHRAFFASDQVDLQGEADIENHYPLYLDDQNW